MRLHHWTWRYNVESIRSEGFHPSGDSNPFYDGVHTLEAPIAGRGMWGDVCCFGDVPEELLDASWKKWHSGSETWTWVLPYAFATEHLRHFSEAPEAVNDLVYLEVWTEDVTAAEGPGELLEAALGGPDTSVRSEPGNADDRNCDRGDAAGS